jgi:hypothetical protein
MFNPLEAQIDALFLRYHEAIDSCDSPIPEIAGKALESLASIQQEANKLNSLIGHPKDKQQVIEIIDKIKLGCSDRLFKKLAPSTPAPIVDSLPISRVRFDEAFAKLAKEDHFRMYIDFSRQHEGPDTFDKQEPGYAKAMESAIFEYVRDHIGVRFTAENLAELHDVAVDGVSDSGVSFIKGIKLGCTYTIDMSKVTEAAKKEWDAEKLIFVFSTKVPPNMDFEEFSNTYLSFQARGPLTSQIKNTFESDVHRDTVIKRINDEFNKYYERLEKAKNPKEKLDAIAKLCRAVEVAHIFTDGNQRTIVFGLLNKLLIENGFSPVILENPFVFDGYHSADELVQDIEKGMRNFQDCCKKIYPESPSKVLPQ